ncbi:hypothetical protein JHK84_045362 [Glycine max]|nr:hypothetical protein JHK84_045362 [Glycine max]
MLEMKKTKKQKPNKNTKVRNLPICTLLDLLATLISNLRMQKASKGKHVMRLEGVKMCGARVLTFDQIEGLKNPDVQCWGTEEGDDADPLKLFGPTIFEASKLRFCS